MGFTFLLIHFRSFMEYYTKSMLKISRKIFLLLLSLNFYAQKILEKSAWFMVSIYYEQFIYSCFGIGFSSCFGLCLEKDKSLSIDSLIVWNIVTAF